MGNRKPCVGNIELRPKGSTGAVFMGPFGFYCVRDAGRGPSNITDIVNTPVILLFSKKWAPGLSAEDNITHVHVDLII